jgi:hypothetical protein
MSQIVDNKGAIDNGRRKFYHNPITSPNTYTCRFIIILLVSGDIAENPAPIRNPCGDCTKPVKSNQRVILCDGCSYWYHLKCTELSLTDYNNLSQSNKDWYCRTCILPNFTDSYFDNSVNEESNTSSIHEMSYFPSSNNTTSGINNQHVNSIFESLREARKNNPRNFMIAHININSIRYKFNEIREMLDDKIVDLLLISETKLDQTFNDRLFTVGGYKPLRRGRNCRGGGVMALMNSEFPISRKNDTEFKDLENICLQVYINDRKWLVMGLCKPPSINDNDFSKYCTKSLDKCMIHYE